MRRFYSSLVLFTAFASLAKLSADTVESAQNQLDDLEVQAVREWINTKRQVSVRETGGNLSISGEAATEFSTTNSRVSGIRQLSPGGATSVPSIDYKVGFSLLFDYRMERSWLAGKLKFKNKSGLFGGTFDKIKLDKAYWGVRAYSGETATFDVELGRRNLGSIFDSRIQFDSLFDGLLLRYNQGFESVGNWFVQGGPFIIDSSKAHYGYVGEIGFLQISNTGLFVKYSLIDWDTKRTNYEHVQKLSFQFLNSQLILGYNWYPKWLDGKQVQIYLSGLYNHDAQPHAITAYKRAAWAGYAGFLMGRTRKKGDWSLEANYQVVAAQSIPSYDVGGIGIGNASSSGFYYNTVDSALVPTTRRTAQGNTNFQGYMINLNYLLTDALNFKQVWRQSITLDSDIGPFRRFMQYEIDFIYAF